MFEIFHDIRQQRQELEFKDGLFFNGLEGMSIRVGKQDDDTRLLHDVLIFDTRSSNGDMTTTVADSGYIKMSDDKNYLYVTLFEGETYEQTRGAQWYDRNGLRHHLFERQDGTIPLSNLSQSDKPNRANEAQTRNMSELQMLIDSLQTAAEAANSMSYAPLIKEQIFVNDISVLPGDSIRIDKSRFKPIDIYDSIAALGTRDRYRVYNAANNAVRNSRGIYSFDEQSSKYTLTQLYRSRNEWHRKLALPISIFVFFLIGAPLGAIIRKGRPRNADSHIGHILRHILCHKPHGREAGQGGYMGFALRHVAADIHPFSGRAIPYAQGHQRLVAARYRLVRGADQASQAQDQEPLQEAAALVAQKPSMEKTP